VTGADPQVPEQILASYGARQWALTLAELWSEAHKTTATVRMVMSRSLSFMADPALAASVLPGPGEGVSIPAFLNHAEFHRMHDLVGGDLRGCGCLAGCWMCCACS
jgi:hypothetical protein